MNKYRVFTDFPAPASVTIEAENRTDAKVKGQAEIIAILNGLYVIPSWIKVKKVKDNEQSQN